MLYISGRIKALTVICFALSACGLHHCPAALSLSPPSDCLFVFSPLLPFLSSSPPRLLLVLLCLVAAAEECTLSGLTRSPLKASELLAAASGNTTRSPEPCSGTAGSPFAHRSCRSQKHWSTLMLKNCKNFIFSSCLPNWLLLGKKKSALITRMWCYKRWTPKSY